MYATLPYVAYIYIYMRERERERERPSLMKTGIGVQEILTF
jgi:hypothetical protein